MPTSTVNLDVSQYVRVNIGLNPITLQAHNDHVKIVFSDTQPAKSNTSVHMIGGNVVDPWRIAAIDTNVWALAMTVTSSLVVTEFPTALMPVASSMAAGPQLDAFGRQRVSDTDQRLDVEFLYDKMEEFFDEVTNGASASVTHNANTRDLTLTVGSVTNGESASMSSHPVPYTPGNSQLLDITGVLNLANLSGGTVECFLRSSISGSVADLDTVTQASWLSSTSGVNWEYSHIFQIDFQSLKVGTIRFNMVRNGIPENVAVIHNDNLRDSGYWQNPSLPAYYKIYNDATNTYCEIGYGNDANAIGFRFVVAANAAATMKAICCTVKSEGGGDLSDLLGIPNSVDVGVTAKTVGTTEIPLLSIRCKEIFKGFDNLILTLPKGFSFSASNPVKLTIYHDVVLTGESWTDVDALSSVEYDTSATSFTNGHKVYSDYVITAAKNAADSTQGVLGKSVLWNRLGVETGVLTIAAIRTDSTNANCYSALQWEEIR